MRKEITGILLLSLVLFTAVSLFSYSPADPALHNASSGAHIQNFFGLAGAHLAGLLIGFFGMGAFWVPVLLLIVSFRFNNDNSKNGHAPVFVGIGGIMLIIVTGAIFSIFADHYSVFGNSVMAGGIIGSPLKSAVSNYANPSGAVVILLVCLIIGFILATGISVIKATRNGLRLLAIFARKVNELVATIFGFLKTYVKLPRKKPRAIPPAKPKRSKPLSDSPRPELMPIPIKADPETALPKKTDIKIKTSVPPIAVQSVTPPRQQVLESMMIREGFQLPPLTLLDDPVKSGVGIDPDHLREQSHLLEQKLGDFGVQGRVTEVLPGPVITRYEFAPAPGVKINKIVNLSDDLALALKAMSVRIIAPIPGKSVIGIELPNLHRETVGFKDIVSSAVYEKAASRLTIALGKDIVGHPVVADLGAMPHLLIAGATGTGKSVALNTMITSILYKATPEDTKFIMIDPKRIELSMYDGIPHLITPVVTDMKKATNALFWAVREMERRYKLLSEKRVRNIKQYNAKIAKEPPAADEPPPENLPFIVVVIDELADLMMVASRDVEVGLTRLAQMARAAGIHLIIATQRPSVDVLTGLIKANFPTRLSFQVSSKIDSRTIIDSNGAEALLGKGDMLFLPPGTGKLQRIHGAYLSEDEVTRVIDFLKSQKAPEYDLDVIETPAPEAAENGESDTDDRYDEAVALVTRTGQASISMVQRHLRIGYNRAARIIEMMEKEGVVGPSDGVKQREVLVRGSYDDMP